MPVQQFKSRRFARIILAVLLINLVLPLSFSGAQSESKPMGLEMDLRLRPTSIVVTPATVTVEESDSPTPIQFTATAKYEYPGVDPAIPDKVVTNESIWDESSDDHVAMVGPTGLVTPVGDLDQGSAVSIIEATYGGVSCYDTPVANTCGKITVTGEIEETGGGGGGGSSGGGTWDDGGGDTTPPADDGGDDGTPLGDDGGDETIPPTDDGGDETTPPTDDGGDETTPPTDDGGDETTPPTDDGGDETTPPTDDGGDETTPPGDDGGDQTTPPTDGGGDQTGGDGTSTSPGSGEYLPEENQFVSDVSYLPIDFALSDRTVRPLSEVFSASELTLAPGEIGVTRAAVMARMADRMNIFTLRKDLLDRCYRDIENCTNTYSMFSLYSGINLDPDNLVLFPDTKGLPEEDAINKMVLLGFIQGYYGIEQSPFLPQKPILRIETLKVLSTILDSLEKAQPDYERGDFAYNILFYREIYAASLLARLDQQELAYAGQLMPKSMWLNIRLAHALTEEAWQLIKAQKTPFSDIRPDLYDTHWYYPIVIDKICAKGLFVCSPGSKLDPDKSPAPEQVDQYIDVFNKYIEERGLDVEVSGDKDEDGIFNIDENSVYFTNPLVADTDSDLLLDGDEILTYKTNPTVSDTDEDGLDDGQEINEYKTDPNLYDTDEDSFSDGVEIAEGSDPLSKTSVPADKNGNRVSDVWETKYNLIVVDGSQDTDGDGITDILEYQYSTNPTRIDSDMDGYTDAEEILELKTDPNDAEDPGSSDNLPVLINNFQYGQIVADASPMVRGIGPASLGNNVVKIQIMLRNEFGSELMLGETTTDARGRFVFIPELVLKNGTYFLQARSINKGQVKSSELVKIIIDSTLEVLSAKPEKLEEVPITEEVLLKKLVLSVDSTDGRPVLSGTLSEFGSRVNITWQSLVVSSALIADTTDGSFSMKAPKLEPGQHIVYVQTVRKKDNVVGKTVKIVFDMRLVGESKGSAAEKSGTVQAVTANVVKFVSEQSWPFWVGVGVVALLVAGGCYVFLFGEGGAGRKKK